MHAKVQHQRNLHLYGVASCVGAKDPRCDLTPDLVLKSDILNELTHRGIPVSWKNTFRMQDKSSSLELPQIFSQLASSIEHSVKQGSRFAVIGGDHSCAIGTWSGAAQALKNQKGLGLIWFDAHMDAHVPDTSPSGALHGMPLAYLLGEGGKPFDGILRQGSILAPQNICLIGVRSFENAEAGLLESHGVKVYKMDEVKRRGLKEIVTEAVKHVSAQTSGFGISIDMDVFDPVDAPGVGSPERDGLLAKEFVDVAHLFASDPQFIGAEIVEFNPYRDRNRKTEWLVYKLLKRLFNQ